MSTEMKSRPHPESGSDDATPAVQELDANALAAIRNLIEAEPKIEAQPVEERVAEKAARTQAQSPAPSETPKAASPSSHSRAAAAPRASAVPSEPRPAAARTAPAEGRFAALKARVTGYRPTPRHLIWASVALLVVLRPWLVLGLLFLSLMVIIGVFLILGYDGFWTRAMAFARWYAGRRPHRAAELHRKLDDFAMKWDAILDRFPEGSVDGLYLPDFGELATADKRHDEAMERRLAHLREGKA